MLLFPTTEKSAKAQLVNSGFALEQRQILTLRFAKKIFKKASLYRYVNMSAHNYRREGKETPVQTDGIKQ